MNKMHWVGLAAALSVASTSMTALAFCSNEKPLVNGRTGTVRCSSGGDQGQGNLVLNAATLRGAGSAFLEAGTVSATMQGFGQFAVPISTCTVRDPAPKDPNFVTKNVTCTGLVIARLTVD